MNIHSQLGKNSMTISTNINAERAEYLQYTLHTNSIKGRKEYVYSFVQVIIMHISISSSSYNYAYNHFKISLALEPSHFGKGKTM